MKKITIIIILFILTIPVFAQEKTDKEVINNVTNTVKAIIELEFMVKFGIFKSDVEKATIAIASEFALNKDTANYTKLCTNYKNTKQMCDNFTTMIARDLSDVNNYNYFQEHAKEKQLEYINEFNKIITQYNTEIFPFYKEHTQIYKSPYLSMLVELLTPIVTEIAKYTIDKHVKPWLTNKILQIVTNRLLKPFYFSSWENVEKQALSNPATGEYMQAPISIVPNTKVVLQPNIRNELNGDINFNIIYKNGSKTKETILFNKNNNIY